jgi:hypothetical protein
MAEYKKNFKADLNDPYLRPRSALTTAEKAQMLLNQEFARTARNNTGNNVPSNNRTKVNINPSLKVTSRGPGHQLISGALQTRVALPKGFSAQAAMSGGRETLKVPGGRTLSRGGFGVNSFGVGYQKGGFQGGATLDPKSGKVVNAGFKVTKYF